MLGEVEHVLRQLHVLDVVEILGFGPDLVWIAEQGADQTLLHRFESDDVLAAGQHHAADRDHVHAADRLPNDGVGIVSDLAVWAR